MLITGGMRWGLQLGSGSYQMMGELSFFVKVCADAFSKGKHDVR